MHINVVYITKIILILDTICAESNLLSKIKNAINKNAYRYQHRVDSKEFFKNLNSLEELIQKEKYFSDGDNKEIQSLPKTYFIKSFTPGKLSTQQEQIFQVVTEEPQYYELWEQFPGVSLITDYTTSASSMTKKRVLGETNNKAPPKFLLHKKSTTFNVSKEYPNPPPWVKYKPMKLRDIAGNLISLKLPESSEGTLPNHTNTDLLYYKYPRTRKRWRWEYGEHHMHWLFWHCHHWIFAWEINPPSNRNEIISYFNKKKDNEKEILDDLYYQNNKEAYFYKYCNWLLQKENVSQFQENIGYRTLRTHEYNNTKVFAAECFHCAVKVNLTYMSNTPGNNRYCRRAFHDPFYYKFRYYMKAKCFTSSEYLHNDVFDPTTSQYTIISYFRSNSCVTITTDVGEMYEQRTCRYDILHAKMHDSYYSLTRHVQTLELANYANQEGCWSSPYSLFLPLTAPKVGFYARVTVCACMGKYCNSYCRVLHSNELIISLLLVKLFLA